MKKYVQEMPTYLVRIETIEEPIITEITLEIEALMRYIKEEMEKVVSMGRMVPPDVLLVLDTIDEPGKFADMACANLGLHVEKAQEILEIIDPIERLQKAFRDHRQRDRASQYAGQDTLPGQGRNDQEPEGLLPAGADEGDHDPSSERADERDRRGQRTCGSGSRRRKCPKEVEKEAKKQVERLEMMHPDAIESNMLRTYIEWLVELPWSDSTKDNIEIER